MIGRTGCFSLACLIAFCAGVQAQTRTWDNEALTGRWSNPTNWTPDGVPQAGEAVIFDGTSVSNCLADTVNDGLASLTLANGYSGTVTFETNAVSGGMALTVTGAVTVEGGNLAFNGDTTAIGDGTASRKFGIGYFLQAGSLSIGPGAALHSDGKGFAPRTGPGAGSSAGNGDDKGAGYGGQGANSLATGMGGLYGTAASPTALGSGPGHTSGGRGGGAIRLSVSGAITVNGRLSANGANGATFNYAHGGSGGSLWLESGTLQGTGVVSASAGLNGAGGNRGSGGGRMDLSGVVNNFDGTFQVMGGTNAGVRGMAGSILFPASAGSGLTLARFAPTNVLYLGYGLMFERVVVTNGALLGLDANRGE